MLRQIPMDLPSIRPLLTDLHPADVVTLEENCVARFWLPAKFEGSALSVVNPAKPLPIALPQRAMASTHLPATAGSPRAWQFRKSDGDTLHCSRRRNRRLGTRLS
jgi:hypothetical protein